MAQSNSKKGWSFVLEYTDYQNKPKTEEFVVFNGAVTRQAMLGVSPFVITRKDRFTGQEQVVRRG